MITVGLEGGLGNTLFQLAFGKSLAKRRGEEVAFTRWRLDNDPNGRRYELGHFKAEVKIVEREEPPITQDTWYFNADPQGRSFTGHWQSEKYFDAPLVREELRLARPPGDYSLWMADKIKYAPSAFLHVRRGDYTLPDRIAYHGQCSDAYYFKAIQYIRHQLGDINFFVFSDEPDWCREHFPVRFNIVRENPAHEDLWLMSLCNHAITANSTFSWWGCWLGDTQPNRIVIAPERWFACGLNSSDVVPDRWLKFAN